MRRARTAGSLAALLMLGFVLPSDRIVQVMAERRARNGPLRVELRVLRLGTTEAAPLLAELHPDRGMRLDDGAGGRWLVQSGRVTGLPGQSPPDWIPELDVMVLRSSSSLERWLAAQEIARGVSWLARCGDADCFVLGARQAPSQLWIDKDTFDVRRFRSRQGRLLEAGDYRDWLGIRFPERVRLSDALGPIAEIEVRSVEPAPDLEGADFSVGWLPVRP